MPRAPELDIISEVMALTSRANTRNVIMMAAEGRGSLDAELFRAAAHETADQYPAVQSVLNEKRKGARFFLVREHHPEIQIPVFSGELKSEEPSRSSFDLLVQHLRPRLERTWNLMREPPVEFHVLRKGKGAIAAVLWHHSAGDAAMTLRVFGSTLARYDAIVTGKRPEWMDSPYSFSTGKKQASVAVKAGWTAFFSQLKRDLAHRKVKPARLYGHGKKNDLTEWHMKHVFSPEETELILHGFHGQGVHVVDHLVACANMAMANWNQIHGRETGLISSVITVNMRERFGGAEEKNYSSTIFVRSTPETRVDYATLARSVAEARVRQFEAQVDLHVRKSLERGARFFRMLPFRMRRRVASFFMDQQRYSIAVAFLGLVWPQYENGRPTGDSALAKIGDLDLFETHGTGYKLAGNVDVNLAAYIYQRRLNLVLTSSADILTSEECADFLNLLVQTMLAMISSPKQP
ncbi:MAG: hypothetical protein FJ118_06110 [Deltaproteobacteria bacterium]|nr:hypothetical protein [Deltaproteobacteria bacterium]